jgi:hypothetical protein
MRNLWKACALAIAFIESGAHGFSCPSAGLVLRCGTTRNGLALDTQLPAVRSQRRGGQAARLAMNWADPDWNWGYAAGKAHDSAAVLRRALSSADNRQKWVTALLNDEKMDWEVVKLCLALKWQKAAREGRDGGKGGYGDVLERLVACKCVESPTSFSLANLLPTAGRTWGLSDSADLSMAVGTRVASQRTTSSAKTCTHGSCSSPRPSLRPNRRSWGGRACGAP